MKRKIIAFVVAALMLVPIAAFAEGSGGSNRWGFTMPDWGSSGFEMPSMEGFGNFEEFQMPDGWGSFSDSSDFFKNPIGTDSWGSFGDSTMEDWNKKFEEFRDGMGFGTGNNDGTIQDIESQMGQAREQNEENKENGLQGSGSFNFDNMNSLFEKMHGDVSRKDDLQTPDFASAETMKSSMQSVMGSKYDQYTTTDGFKKFQTLTGSYGYQSLQSKASAQMSESGFKQSLESYGSAPSTNKTADAQYALGGTNLANMKAIGNQTVDKVKATTGDAHQSLPTYTLSGSPDAIVNNVTGGRINTVKQARQTITVIHPDKK